jgi:hypothetical protein
MRRHSLVRAGYTVSAWAGICLVLMFVGFATLTSQPSGNLNDVTITLSDGDVALMTLALWVCGVVVLLAVWLALVVVRRLWHFVTA